MKARIVKIGNSRGIRIPKPMIEQAGLVDNVDVVVRGKSLVITPMKHPRAGWAESAASMPKNERGLIWPHVPTKFDAEEWKWE